MSDQDRRHVRGADHRRASRHRKGKPGGHHGVMPPWGTRKSSPGADQYGEPCVERKQRVGCSVFRERGTEIRSWRRRPSSSCTSSSGSSGATTSPTRRLVNIIDAAYYIGFISMGVTFVIISGGIDLSIGTVMMCAAIIGGTALKHGFPMVPSLLLIIAVGARIRTTSTGCSFPA